MVLNAEKAGKKKEKVNMYRKSFEFRVTHVITTSSTIYNAPQDPANARVMALYDLPPHVTGLNVPEVGGGRDEIEILLFLFFLHSLVPGLSIYIYFCAFFFT